jgi:uncharacterized protein YjiK
MCSPLPLAIFLATLVATQSSPARAQSAFPGDLPGTEIGGGLPQATEPSGVAWHLRLGALFLVDDNGKLIRMDAEGNVTQIWSLGSLDLEAVCIADPQTDLVYLGLEHPDGVIEFDVSAGVIKRVFDLSGTLQGPVNEGLEALAFARDPNHPEGGLFYAGLQEDGRVYVFELSIASSAVLTQVIHRATLTPAPGHDDLAGLEWVAASDTFLAVYDSSDQLIAFDSAGVVSDIWQLPGHDQEGLALDGCRLFVAQDTGEVWRYESFPDPSGCDTLQADTVSLSLSAGGTQSLTLEFGATRAGDYYLLLGTITDTFPGFTFSGVHIPLTVDPYLSWTLAHPNQPPLAMSLGVLDTSGSAAATFSLAPGADPALAGIVLYHSAVVLDSGVVQASNPVPLNLVP